MTLCRDDQGRFPDYPSDDEGGSASIFHPERVRASAASASNGQVRPASPDSNEEEENAAKKKEEEKGKSGGKRESVDKKGGGAGTNKEADEEEEGGFTLKPSDFVRQLKKGQKTFEGGLIIAIDSCIN